MHEYTHTHKYPTKCTSTTASNAYAYHVCFFLFTRSIFAKCVYCYKIYDFLWLLNAHLLDCVDGECIES